MITREFLLSNEFADFSENAECGQFAIGHRPPPWHDANRDQVSASFPPISVLARKREGDLREGEAPAEPRAFFRRELLGI